MRSPPPPLPPPPPTLSSTRQSLSIAATFYKPEKHWQSFQIMSNVFFNAKKERKIKLLQNSKSSWSQFPGYKISLMFDPLCTLVCCGGTNPPWEELSHVWDKKHFSAIYGVDYTTCNNPSLFWIVSIWAKMTSKTILKLVPRKPEEKERDVLDLCTTLL